MNINIQQFLPTVIFNIPIMLTFEGRGQSSNSNIITEGPRGLCIGITLTIELTTCIQPSSLSAIAFNFNIAGGGS